MGMPSLIGGLNRYPTKYLNTYGIGGTNLVTDEYQRPSLMREQEPLADGSQEAPQSIAPSLMKNEQDPYYGLSAPEAPAKDKWWETMLKYVGGYLGSNGGPGGVAGIGSTFLNEKEQQQKNYNERLKAFGDERKFLQKEREIDVTGNLKRQQMKDEAEYRKGMLKLGKEKVDAYRDKPTSLAKPTSAAEYGAAIKRAVEAGKQGIDADPADMAIIDYYRQENGLPPLK